MKEIWLVIRTSSSGRPICLPLREGTTTVGRGGGCDIIIPDKKISRLHLTISRNGDQITYEDKRPSARGKGGSFVCNEPLLIHDTELELFDDIDRLLSHDPKDDRSSPEWSNFTTFLNALRKSTDTRSLLGKLLSGLVSLFNADRGYVLLREGRDAPLVPIASHLLDDVEEFVKVSSTISRKAMKSNQAILIENTKKSQLCAGAASLMETGPRTVMCCPLISGHTIHGVIYIDRPSHGSSFLTNQVHLFESAAGLAAGILSERQTRQRLLEANKRLKAMKSIAEEGANLVVGEGKAGRELGRLLSAAAEQDVNVLITGETGTGKEMVARALHGKSKRSNSPFVAVNCAALPFDVMEAELFGYVKGAFTGAESERMGRFELASGGTLFLDEIGELPNVVQVKLLRVLQDRKIARLGSAKEIPLDFRLLCATNMDLDEAVKKGKFRKDLFYRINVFRIPLLPLKKRPEDIVPLANHFLKVLGRSFGKKITKFAPGALNLMTKYNWPGNIRELRNAIERAVVVEQGDTIRAANLPISHVQAIDSPSELTLQKTLPFSYEEAKIAFERAFLKRAIEMAKGNITQAAKSAGMTRYTIYRRLEKLGMIEPGEDG